MTPRPLEFRFDFASTYSHVAAHRVAPSFRVDDELFWGQDRIEDALARCVSR